MTHLIRKYVQEDVEGIKNCIVELQDFERIMDPNRLQGIEVARQYLEHLLEIAKQEKGSVFVVEINGEIVGMISVYIEEDHKHFRKVHRFAYISDIIVLPEYKDQGIIKELIEKAEEYAKSKNVDTIQTAVLSNYAESIEGFQRNGFHNFEIVLRKQI